MAWDATKVLVHNWPHLFGWHCNIAQRDVPEAAHPYLINPSSPENVFAGDPGRFEEQYDSEGNYTGSIVTVPFETGFLLFPHEETAKAAMPELWQEDAAA